MRDQPRPGVWHTLQGTSWLSRPEYAVPRGAVCLYSTVYIHDVPSEPRLNSSRPSVSMRHNRLAPPASAALQLPARPLYCSACPVGHVGLPQCVYVLPIVSSTEQTAQVISYGKLPPATTAVTPAWACTSSRWPPDAKACPVGLPAAALTVVPSQTHACSVPQTPFISRLSNAMSTDGAPPAVCSRRSSTSPVGTSAKATSMVQPVVHVSWLSEVGI